MHFAQQMQGNVERIIAGVLEHAVHQTNDLSLLDVQPVVWAERLAVVISAVWIFCAARAMAPRVGVEVVLKIKASRRR